AFTKLWIVLDRRSLGDLDDDPFRILHLVLVERRIAEVMRVDVEEQQLAGLEVRIHPLDRAAATQPAQLPHEIRLGGDVEHHLGRAQAAHHPTRECLVAVNLLRLGDDDRVVIDVHTALTETRAQVGDAPRAIALLDASRRLRRLAYPTVYQTFESDLWVVVHVRAADVDIEQGRNLIAVLR